MPPPRATEADRERSGAEQRPRRPLEGRGARRLPGGRMPPPGRAAPGPRRPSRAGVDPRMSGSGGIGSQFRSSGCASLPQRRASPACKGSGDADRDRRLLVQPRAGRGRAADPRDPRGARARDVRARPPDPEDQHPAGPDRHRGRLGAGGGHRRQRLPDPRRRVPGVGRRRPARRRHASTRTTSSTRSRGCATPACERSAGSSGSTSPPSTSSPPTRAFDRIYSLTACEQQPLRGAGDRDPPGPLGLLPGPGGDGGERRRCRSESRRSVPGAPGGRSPRRRP